MVDFTIREGSTEPIVFLSKYTNLSTPIAVFDLSDVTLVTLYLRDSAGTVSTFDTSDTTELDITDAAAGEVTFYPAEATFTHALNRYKAYLNVTLANGKVVSFPNDDELEIYVRESFA